MAATSLADISTDVRSGVYIYLHASPTAVVLCSLTKACCKRVCVPPLPCVLHPNVNLRQRAEARNPFWDPLASFLLRLV